MKNSITGKIRVLAIIVGHETHVSTPALLNPLLQKRAIDAVLVPLCVASEALGPVINGLKEISNFCGAVIAMPHKYAVVEYIDELTPEAKQLGAVSVIRRCADGRFAGTMLDGEGFVAGFKNAGHEIKGKDIYLAGAGGTAAGIAYALCRHGATRLSIYNRTAGKAEALAGKLRRTWPHTGIEVGGHTPSRQEIVINATPCGMRENDGLPFDASGLSPDTIAAEVIVKPVMTSFLKKAKQRGCGLHFGESMLQGLSELMLDFILA